MTIRKTSLLASLVAMGLTHAALAGAPATPKQPVTDELQGQKIVDEYRWLEDWNDAKVKAWSQEQNAYTRSKLDAIACASDLRDRVTELENSVGVEHHGLRSAGGRLFGIKNQPPKQQPLIVRLTTLDGIKGEQVILDPNELDTKGGTSFDWFVPSPDGKLVAISLSAGGSESGDVHVYDADTGKLVAGEIVPRVNGGTAGGALAWTSDSKGFYYSRYPRAGERPEGDMDFFTHVYYHQIGTPSDRDRYEIGGPLPRRAGASAGKAFLELLQTRTRIPAAGSSDAANANELSASEVAKMSLQAGAMRDALAKGRSIEKVDQAYLSTINSAGFEFPRIAEIQLETEKSGPRVLATVQNGDGGTYAIYVREGDGAWNRIANYPDKIVMAKFGPDSSIYLVSRQDAPMGKVLRLDAGSTKLEDAKVVIPEQKGESPASVQTDFSSQSGLVVTRSKLYVLYQVGGPNQLRSFELDGKPNKAVPQFEVSVIDELAPIGSDIPGAGEGGDDVIFQMENMYTPPRYFRFHPQGDGTGEVTPTGFYTTMPPAMPNLQIKRDFAISKDGTKVPLTIVSLASSAKPDGKTPTLIWGYGGYGVNQVPTFSRRRIVWLEQGGIYVMAHIRGGGEYGDEWHRQGNLTRKQNVFDDFAAACEFVVKAGYTNPDKLAIMGGSNGGLLMGALITQRPELCKAVVSSVGIYDMLRVELSPNGAFNITEFGTVTDPEQFKALYAYSPYHHVKDGQKYPAVLFMTGANDPRVDPMQSRKMTARLQAASPEGLFLLRTSGNTGHGSGTPLSARIEQTVDQYAFLFDQLGVKVRRTAAPKDAPPNMPR